ncbi:MAG: transposase, partial [Deltaproteobacteria bacterium]|nr:transposase [Deltaproteobacteria bacterium]
MLHGVVRAELEGFVSQRRGPEGDGLPGYVEGELRRYLACGILAQGFTRVRCAGCKIERLVAFSCKGRGVCPSCGARRMSDTAARLVERVLPVTAYRQWVLTVPFPLRFRLARYPARITEVLGELQRAIRRSHRARAKALGLPGGETAAVTFVQRFGSALNLHPHLHVVVADALFVKDGEAVRTVPLPPPTNAEVAEVLARVVRRLERKERVAARDVAAEPAPDGLAREQTEAIRGVRVFAGPDERRTRATVRCARAEGYTLHANVFIPAHDRESLERLCRYGARPSFSLSRLSELPDGRVVYRTRKKLKDGTRTLVLTREQLLGRLAALIPPPRANLVRFHGALAPASKLRKRIVPAWSPPSPKEGSKPRNDRMDWASLLKRVYKTDVFQCGACDGRARPIAVIQDPEVVKKILRHLGLPAEAPRVAPARVIQPDLPLERRLEAANELDEPVDVARLPRWMRAPGARERRGQELEDEAVDVSKLPAWMRGHASAAGQEVKPARDLELVDGEVDVSRLPAWMRSARPSSARRVHWHRRRPEPEPLYLVDESPVMDRLPAWMTWGWQKGPAPPKEAEAVDWNLVDPPSPEGFV